MNRFLKNPHDEFFKVVFSKKEVIKDFLKDFLKLEVDFSSLSLIPTEKKRYKKLFLDLAFKTKYKNKDTQIYLIFEHKSYPDKMVYFQILSYAMSIWEEEKENLTPIIPIIFYHGKNFEIKENFNDLFITQTPYNLNWKLKIFNLNKINDEKFLQCTNNLFLCSALFTMKHIFDETKKLKAIAKNFDKMSENEYFLIIEYISAYKDEKEEKIIDELIENKEKKVTILEKWINQGIEQGIQQGIEIGEKRGEKRGILKGKILTMLEFGLKKEEIAKKLNIEIKEIENILKEK